jgi:hypothetical protein
MSIHVAYSEGEPVACGRLYLPPRSAFGELAGGRTKSSHRNRGFRFVTRTRPHVYEPTW